MRSSARQSIKMQADEKHEIIFLQKENTVLRNNLKELGLKLNELIERKENFKKKNKTVTSTAAAELKEAYKTIEIYK